MIKGLTGSNGITVNGGNTSLQYVSQNTTNPIQGMIRIWGTDMQVFDGSGWTNIQSSYATVSLDPEIQLVIDWARKKMISEEVLLSLPSDNPAVKIARANVNRIRQELKQAEEQLKITEILSQDEYTTAS
jgi:hypothetical protein